MEDRHQYVGGAHQDLPPPTQPLPPKVTSGQPEGTPKSTLDGGSREAHASESRTNQKAAQDVRP